MSARPEPRELLPCDVPDVEDDEQEPAEGAIDTDETWQRWKAYAERLGIAT